MHPFPFEEPARVAFSGDWHMNAARVEHVLFHAANDGADVVLQLGDFGVWSGDSGEQFRSFVNRTAARLNLPVVFVDGNHEDFDLLESIPVDASGVRALGTHLFHAPRNLRWTWGDLEFCAFGGATSLDRPQRVQGVSWWPQEEQTKEDLTGLAAAGRCDILLSHDCPAGVPVPGIVHRRATGFWPLDELERAWQHRERFAAAVAEVEPTHLFHGHFHKYHRSVVECFGGRTTVIGLGSDNSDRDELTVVYDLEEILAESQRQRRYEKRRKH